MKIAYGSQFLKSTLLCTLLLLQWGCGEETQSGLLSVSSKQDISKAQPKHTTNNNQSGANNSLATQENTMDRPSVPSPITPGNSTVGSDRPIPQIQAVSIPTVRAGQTLQLTGENFLSDESSQQQVFFILENGEYIQGIISKISAQQLEIIIPLIENQREDLQIAKIGLYDSYNQIEFDYPLVIQPIIFSDEQTQIKQKTEALIQGNETAKQSLVETLDTVLASHKNVEDAVREINIAFSAAIHTEADAESLSQNLNGLVLAFEQGSFRIQQSQGQGDVLIFTNGMNNNFLGKNDPDAALHQEHILRKSTLILDNDGSQKIQSLEINKQISLFGSFVGSIRAIQDKLSRTPLQNTRVLGVFLQGNAIFGELPVEDVVEIQKSFCELRHQDILSFPNDYGELINLYNNFGCSSFPFGPRTQSEQGHLTSQNQKVIAALDTLIREEVRKKNKVVLMPYSQGTILNQVLLARYRNLDDEIFKSDLRKYVGFLGLASLSRYHLIGDIVPNYYYITNNYDKLAELFQYGIRIGTTYIVDRKETESPPHPRVFWTDSKGFLPSEIKFNNISQFSKNHILEDYLNEPEPLQKITENLSKLYQDLGEKAASPAPPEAPNLLQAFATRLNGSEFYQALQDYYQNLNKPQTPASITRNPVESGTPLPQENPALPSAPQVGTQFSNSLGMTFSYIPPGTFIMGSPPSEEERNSNEIPHQVTLSKGFYMQTTEVTQKQWLSVMGKFPGATTSVPNETYGLGDNYPMYYVSWQDAQSFVGALNAKEGGFYYRLPSEAEWEYAARASTSSRFACPGGDDTESCLASMGWYRVNSENKSHPVGQKVSNSWGLFDMHGNVEEWTQYDFAAYPTEAQTDPVGTSKSSGRVFRGGHWNSSSTYSRSASRNFTSPSGRYAPYGFRVLRSNTP
jgi:formylglycine-generating enzyme required for sulfatase activity